MSLIKEFKEFAMKGSVVDLAVGVVIGAAFGKIVSSFVSNIVMPPLNLLTSKYGVNFNQMAWKVEMESPELDKAGKIVLNDDGGPKMIMQDYPIMNYGPFLQTIVDFLLVAAAIFVAVKIINRMKAAFEEEKAAAPPAEDIQLLREIRDSLQK